MTPNEPTTAPSGCPECGGTGARGCGAGWHDGKPDAPSPLDEPTAAPSRPTGEQARQPLNDMLAIAGQLARADVFAGTDSDNVSDATIARVQALGTLLNNARESLSALLAGVGTAQPDPPVTVTYTNWQGETAERHFIPVSLWWGVTEWHPRSGWHLDAFDVDRQAMRSFALSGFDHNVIPLAQRGTAPQVPAEVLWEGDSVFLPTQPGYPDEPNQSQLPFGAWLPVPPGTYVRVVAADGAPQEAQEVSEGDDRGR